MLHLLFPRLTAQPKRGDALFRWVTVRARTPDWYLAGSVPDTVDGRFAMLATITAMILVRCEALGEAGSEASVALSERFIDAMKAEHREMGIGDPTLGKLVQKLVGSLARRVEIWRQATSGGDWAEAARDSVYGGETPPSDSLASTVTGLRGLWSELNAAPIAAITEGEIA